MLGALNDFTANYEGSINNKYEITMQLTKVGSRIGGFYLYKNKGTAIALHGTISDGEIVDLTESAKNKVTGLFNGQLRDGRLTGTWYNSDKSKSMPFSVSQTSRLV